MLLRMSSILISGLANHFSKLAFGEEVLSIDPERPEKAITSALKSSLNFRRLLRVVFSSQQCRY